MNSTDPHMTRARAILEEHPSVRKLYGHTPVTAVYALGCWLLAAGLSYLIHVKNSWMLAGALVLLVGPFIDMMVLVVIHEVCHNLVFRKPWQNRLLGILVNTPMLVPISEAFRQHHTAHHLYLGDLINDVDVPFKVELDLVQNSTLMKMLWLFWNPFILIFRSLGKLPLKWDMYVVLNWVTTIGPAIALYHVSPKCLFFLLGSSFLSQSLHPANARVIQRHVSSVDAHKASATDTNVSTMPNTYSYYGPMNFFTLNVGYHVEHHDFARVPWSNLPALHRLAGEKWYPEGVAHKSRSFQSVIDFISDSRIHLDWFSARQPKKEM